MKLHPFVFRPILKERIWGGSALASVFGRELPKDRPIGESWEISDRPGDVSVIANGPLAGRDVRWLMEQHGEKVMGDARTANGRFPLLAKILDARDRLSLQVHPPAAVADRLDGEPKTEMWYIVRAKPGAMLYAGLRRGTSRGDFERHLQAGTVEQCFHRMDTAAGDSLFLPSGRVHAIGAGNMIFEIQQNSDTTYRVFDWNRIDAHGQPRPLHVAESLDSIDFNDFEPALIRTGANGPGEGETVLADDPLFRVIKKGFPSGSREMALPHRPVVLAVIAGALRVAGGETLLPLSSGQFCLLPACLGRIRLECRERVDLLWAEPGTGIQP